MNGKLAKFLRRKAKETGLDYKTLKKHYKRVVKEHRSGQK